ncbi:3'-5' exoribonuclease [Pseudoalteromonas sp. CnMc7-15]|uniref:3'-5' exonuclease n=1 Tax=unclassified Pseudoalteromonas TaxID=194690 RepID=UPI001EF4FE3E|nr:3'-5' exonuclease [Pseudoalteromonas sp. CnMc7-15]MCG7567090.1 3'-5' exoribonuclease [Pseudoalteromonas sp. CnMc7-15]
MNNVMLDLETMGNGSKAAIVSIGACFFEPTTGEIGAQFHTIVNLKSSAYYGEMDAGTVLWWMEQSDDARKVLLDDMAVSLKDALGEFDEWISQIENFKERVVWGNGCTFDNVILGNAYKACRMRQPWPYFGDRDVRTLVDLGRTLHGFDPKNDMPFVGTRHNAMDDAVHQARYVSAIYSKLNGK